MTVVKRHEAGRGYQLSLEICMRVIKWCDKHNLDLSSGSCEERVGRTDWIEPPSRPIPLTLGLLVPRGVPDAVVPLLSRAQDRRMVRSLPGEMLPKVAAALRGSVQRSADPL